MITDMQTYFQKHYRWMFAVLLVMMVVPFIFAYGPGSTLARTGRGAKGQSGNTFFGYNLSDEPQMQEQARAAAIDRWLKTGTPPFNPDDLQGATFERIVKLDIVNKLGIPTPTIDQLGIYIAGLPPFLDPKGFFSKDKFVEFQGRFSKQEGLSKDYLTDRIAEDWRLDQLTNRLEGASFYLPTTLDREYGLAAAKYKVQAAILLAKIDTTLKVDDTEAKAYFTANKNNYNTEEKREGIIYRIPSEKFLSQVATPTEEQLQKYFESISVRFINWQMKDDKGKITGDTPKAPTLAEHHDETLKLYKQAKAAHAAAEAIDTIVQKIYADKIATGSKAWDELISASGVEKITVKPVTQNDTTTEGTTLENLFARTLPDRAYSEAFQTETDGRFVLLTKIYPSEPQTYEQVAQKVKADALHEKQQKALAETQQKKVESLISAWHAAGGKGDFTKLAAAEGFAISTPEPFLLSKPPLEVSGDALIRGLVGATPNQLISDANPAQATVVLFEERQTPKFSLKDELARQTRDEIEHVYARLATLGDLGEWADKYAR